MQIVTSLGTLNVKQTNTNAQYCFIVSCPVKGSLETILRHYGDLPKPMSSVILHDYDPDVDDWTALRAQELFELIFALIG